VRSDAEYYGLCKILEAAGLCSVRSRIFSPADLLAPVPDLGAATPTNRSKNEPLNFDLTRKKVYVSVEQQEPGQGQRIDIGSDYSSFRKPNLRLGVRKFHNSLQQR